MCVRFGRILRAVSLKRSDKLEWKLYFVRMSYCMSVPRQNMWLLSVRTPESENKIVLTYELRITSVFFFNICINFVLNPCSENYIPNFCFSPMLARYPVHPLLTYLTILILTGAGNKLWCFSICNFLCSPDFLCRRCKYSLRCMPIIKHSLWAIIYFSTLWRLVWPPLWSSGQSSWLQIQRSRVRFAALTDFLRSSGYGTGSTQPHEDNWGATWKESSSSGLDNRN
jgi:hypothetical protein